MPTWTGPVSSTRSPVPQSPVEQARNPIGYLLFRHYGPQTEGRNVYIMVDGTVTETDPIDWTLVSHALYGAHTDTITDAEAVLLSDAGYDAYISWEDSMDTNGVLAASFDAANQRLNTTPVGTASVSTGTVAHDANYVWAQVYDPATNTIRVVN